MLTKYIKFCVVGGTGAVITFGLTWLLNKQFDINLIASIFISFLALIDISFVMLYNWNFISTIPKNLYRLLKYVFVQYKDIVKFCIVGSSGTLLNLGILYLITNKLGVYYIISATIGAVIATIFNYTVNHFWTFQRREIKNNWIIGWLKYKLTDDITILVYLGELLLFTEVFGMWYFLSAIIAIIINYPIRYTILKRFIWKIIKHSQNNPSYEWDSFYNGNPIQMWWKRKIANIVWEWIPNTKELLNIGCGSSPISLKYDNIICIDTNKDKIEFMKKKHTTGNYSLQTTKDFNNESFDYIICIEVIEHLSNPIEMISEISRLLKVNGRLVIATPDYNKKLWNIAEKFTPYKEEHNNHFTMDKLDRLCEKYNLMPNTYKYIAGCDLVEMFIKCN